MKTYRITAFNAAGRWSYIGLFHDSIDAVNDATARGATHVRVIRLP